MSNSVNTEKMKMKRGKKVMIALKILLGITCVLMLIGSILHNTYYKSKYDAIRPYGQMVAVEGKKMHVHSMGSGEDIIVLLPGMGIGLPSADFGPLMRKLSEKYTVVCVEYFGVGFSDKTDTARTCENYVNETREALLQAGFNGPYILMPHSISGIYSEYYATKYPDEINGIILLDSTSTALYAEMPKIVSVVLPIAKFQQSVGMISFLATVTTSSKDLLAKGYTEKEIEDLKTFAAFSFNDTIINQIKNQMNYVKETIDLPFPKSVPVFKIISSQTIKAKAPKTEMTGMAYQQAHLKRLGENIPYKILEGSHFIYLSQIEEIARLTDDFLDDFEID